MQSRHRLFAFAALLLFVVICIGAFFTSNLLRDLVEEVESAFGPPAPKLTSAQQYQLALQLWWQADDLVYATNPLGEEQTFVVSPGEPTDSIIQRLEISSLIRDTEAFRTYLIYSGLDTRLQAGVYKLSPAMTAVEIARKLLDATPEFITFNVLPGWRMEEIAASLPTSGLDIAPEEFLQVAQLGLNESGLLPDLPLGASSEGFLLPDSYELGRQTSARDLLRILTDNFTAQVSNELREGFMRQGLDLFEAVTLASIVEREAIVLEEQPIIASVFLNRLAIEMKLDADPTVQYAVGYNPDQTTWWTNPLTYNDLQIDSPYNTYIYNGLPPGPIANPSISALQAVAFPAQTPYYYFRAACDGSGRHVFAETFEEHRGNACP